MEQQIHEQMNNPNALEKLFRSDPEGFRRNFTAVFNQYPEALILQVWQARFAAEENTPVAGSETRRQKWELLWVILLSLLAGTLAKLPTYLDMLGINTPFAGNGLNFYLQRNLSTIIFLPLVTYFLIRKRPGRVVFLITAFSIVAATLYINLVPFPPETKYAWAPRVDSADTVNLAELHLPIFLLSIAGIAFAGNWLKNEAQKMDFLRYCGEIFIFAMLLLLGMSTLSMILLPLFNAIGIDIMDILFKYVYVYGSIASPLIAAFLIERMTQRSLRIAPILAKVFSPLFLISLLCFLVTTIIQKKDPFADREFLTIINAVLVLVLAMVIFAISEKRETNTRTWYDTSNFGLAAAALIIDGIALSAILFRLASYGFTPNRIAVLGINLIAFIHLGGIFIQYLRFFFKKADLTGIELWITRYLPVYTAWAAFIVFIFPALYRFQ